ncbi:tRNA (5-methylaminomethyl-2-thiouridine)(34)-methyltransferase MnmD [Mucilaginibacter sp. McL0603]|uniref:tRNA (5-methylaminomethyl-2-thiouridine)(34)-methyltransferase MnmD n=1 Tax=Mucilaginibacter sp. McL0603 TaxID=3415670 RepID=UPI003CF4F949
MNHELQIVTTADGSKTIYNSEVGENYHSRHGALQESRHVFLKSGLQYFLEYKLKVSPSTGGGDLEGAEVSVLEVGLGTGLNFLLSADYCTDNKVNLNYTGIEAYPLTNELISQTGYDQYVSASVWDSFINEYPGSLKHPVKINTYCQLQTAHCKLTNFTTNSQYDVIYFDAFASARQPEMWDEDAITHTIHFLKPGGIFVTYAITGNLKRTLKSLGLKIEKAPGAPGKREMLRAVKCADA